MDINLHSSSNPTQLTRVGDELFFAADDGVHGVELWKSDGTAAGTTMVKDVKVGSNGSGPTWLTNVNGTLFFVANDGKHRTQLWKSDGTEESTVRVTDILIRGYPGDPPTGLWVEVPPVAVGSQLYFFNLTCCLGTSELYVTDGTAAGTQLLTGEELLNIPDSPAAAAFNGKLYFVADGEDEVGWFRQLSVSDGSVAGTHALAGAPTADEISILPASGQNLYFVIHNENERYNQLWKTDGTPAGTNPLTAIGQLPGWYVPSEAVYMGTRLYFSNSYWDPERYGDYVQLWRTNGTSAGTHAILTAAEHNRMGGLTKSGGRLFFTVGWHLWKSNGTAAGTVDLGQFGAQMPRELIAVGDELCFAETDWYAGTWSLWESDGSAIGTYAVGTFAGTADVLQQAAVGGKLFFAANDITHGAELWSYAP